MYKGTEASAMTYIRCDELIEGYVVDFGYQTQYILGVFKHNNDSTCVAYYAVDGNGIMLSFYDISMLNELQMAIHQGVTDAKSRGATIRPIAMASE